MSNANEVNNIAENQNENINMNTDIEPLENNDEGTNADNEEESENEEEPENDEPENDEPENDEPENDEPENDEPENDEPENDEPENDEPENDEPEDALANNIDQNNIENSNIKMVIKKKNDNNEESEDELVLEDSDEDSDYFNLSDNSDFDLFENNVISKKQVEVVPEDERLYEDSVYATDLYDTLMQDVPLEKRGSRYIEERIKKEVDEILGLKNRTLEAIRLLKDGVTYPIVDKYVKNEYPLGWVIPVVADTKVIFSKIGKDEFQNMNGELATYDEISKEGTVVKSQINELKELKVLSSNYTKDIVNDREYMTQLFKILAPYETKKDTEFGISKNLLHNTPVLRYDGIDSVEWCERIAMGRMVKTDQIVDPETCKIVKVEVKDYIPGEQIDIVGFFILPFGHESIYDDLAINKGEKLVMDRIGLIGEITNISSSNPVEVTVENHGLKDGEKIFITGSNSFPSIDGTHHKSVKVVNENVFTIDGDVKTPGDKGNLIGSLKLSFETYKVSKSAGGFNAKKIKDVASGRKNPKIEYPKLYLFNDIKIENNEEYMKLMNTILPSIDDIVGLEYPYLSKCNTIDEVNEILKKYMLTYNDLNVKQTRLINRILEKGPERLQKAYNSITFGTSGVSNRNKFMFGDNSFIFSDHYINNEDVIAVYGKYPYVASDIDSISQRVSWVISHKDHGQYYFKIVAKDMVKSIVGLKAEIDKQRNMFEKDLEQINKDFEAEEKMKKFLDGEKACSDKGLLDVTDTVESGDWRGVLEKTGTNHEKGRKALVYKSEEKKYSIFVWSGEGTDDEVSGWVEEEDIPKYELIKYICEFKNMNLTDIEYSDLNCVFKKAIGCHSKIYMKYKNKQMELQKKVDDFKQLSEYVNNPNLLKDIESSISGLRDFLVRDEDIVEVGKKDEEEEENRVEESVIAKTVNKIRSISNVNNRMYILNKLITLDGFLIGENLYSMKYGTIMMCGHHYYNMLMVRSNDDEEKKELWEQLCELFSDDGASEMQNHTCKNCGEILGIRGYDDTEGFNEFGAIKRSRETWTEESTQLVLQDVGAKTSTMEEEFSRNLCGATEFKDLLIKRGLDYKTLPVTMEICEVLVDLAAKAGITLLKRDVTEILVDCTKIIAKNPTFTEFVMKEKKKLKSMGKSKEDIMKIPVNIFKKRYNSRINVQKYATIAARLLITLQTAVPPYSRTSKDTLCAFSGFDGDNGVTYMVCLLDVIFRRSEIALKGNESKEEILRGMLTKNMSEFRKIKSINDLYTNYKQYLLKKEELMDELNNVGNVEEHIFAEYKKIEREFIKSLKEKNKPEEIKKELNKLRGRLNVVSKAIKDSIKKVIKIAPINDVITKATENSCCTESMKDYKGYYGFISETLEDKEIYDLIEESNYLALFLDDFVNKGTMNRLYLSDGRDIAIYNDVVYSGPMIDSEEIIHDKFLYYVPEGEFKGEQRNFIGDRFNKSRFIDMKTGKTMEEIEKEQHSREAYAELLDSIAKKNTIPPEEYESLMMKNKDLLMNLREESEVNLNAKIGTFLNKLSLICKKENDKNFITNYTDLLLNIGKRENQKDYDNIVDDFGDKIELKVSEKIKIERENKTYRIEQMKKLYIEYFMKGVEKVKTQTFNKDYVLDFIDSDKIVDDIQEHIFKESEKLKDFRGKKYSLIFKKVDFNYYPDMISNIYGENDKWSCTYKSVKEYSEFNMDVTFNILLYMFVSQLQQSFDRISADDIKDGEVVLTRNEAAHIFSKFVIDMLDDFQKTQKFFDITEEDLKKLENTKREEMRRKAIQFEENMKGKPIEYYYLKRGTASFLDEIDENYDIETNKDEIQKMENEKRDAIMARGKDELTKKFGEEPTADQLEEFTNKYLEEEYIDAEETLDQMNLIQPKEGLDVIDVGYDYGELPQGIENAGDGIPDNYFEENDLGPGGLVGS